MNCCMADSIPLGKRLGKDLRENLLVSILAVVIAIVAMVLFISLGMSVIVVLGVALAIAQFIPNIYSQYWPGIHSRGFQVTWTVLMGLFTIAIILVVYGALLPFIPRLYASIVAVIIAPIGQYSIALRVGDRQHPT